MTLFVPGRLEVFGKHTDYAGGHALVAALPRGFTVRAASSASGMVTITDLGSGERATFSRHGDGPGEGWRRYPQTVIRRLAANFPEADLSADIEFSSTLPQAAGLSSSSALIIAIAESLIACAGIDQMHAWRAAIASPEDRASYFGCIENGAAFGPLAGDAGVGTHGGSEDHAASVMSRAGHLQLFAFSPLRSVQLVKLPSDWTFVVAWSGVHAQKTGAVRDAYNRLADPARMTGARLEQFEAENGRVVAAADAFARADIDAIADLAAASQRDAEELLGNQVPETRDLVRLALDHGAAAASAFGAGWGGSVWALVRETEGELFSARWIERYRKRHPHLASGVFASPPGDGCGSARRD
ncbi:MAG: galactokinase family protein [Vicinamibacterales bacterium]